MTSKKIKRKERAQIRQFKQRRECPRCKRNCLEDDDVLNSISHTSPGVYICAKCGQMEGLVKLGGSVPQSEILLTEQFEEELKK